MKKHRKFLKDLQTSEQFYDDKESRQIIGELMALIDDGLNKQPKADWIPCEVALPEESLNSVIGWDEYRERCCFVQYYGGRWILGNGDESVKIVAWRNLPQPYKKEGAENDE